MGAFIDRSVVSNSAQVKVREILIAASAAGVACAFGSPIGGVMFSIEVGVTGQQCHLPDMNAQGNVTHIHDKDDMAQFLLRIGSDGDAFGRCAFFSRFHA